MWQFCENKQIENLLQCTGCIKKMERGVNQVGELERGIWNLFMLSSNTFDNFIGKRLFKV